MVLTDFLSKERKFDHYASISIFLAAMFGLRRPQAVAAAALPAEPVAVAWGYCAGGVVLGAILLPILTRLVRGAVSYKGKHVLISGGSSGIGLALAKEFVKRGSHVTIVARTKSKLEDAVAEISKLSNSADQKINYVSADMTDYSAVLSCIAKATQAAGPLDVLVANAGTGVPGYFLEQDVSVFKKAMDTNYMSTVHLIKAAAPAMVDRRQGQIVIVASAAAVVSFIGYSTYAPTKFALRGLADSLRNELLGFNVSVHIAYPPDTDTPGYAEEQKVKPQECADFSALVGTPFKAEAVASSLVSGLSARLYHLPSPDFLQNRLVDTMAGVTPRNNAALEWILLPLLAIVQWVFLRLVDHFGARYGTRIASGKKQKTL
jgi:short-subunit dehydrogenase